MINGATQKRVKTSVFLSSGGSVSIWKSLFTSKKQTSLLPSLPHENREYRHGVSRGWYNHRVPRSESRAGTLKTEVASLAFSRPWCPIASVLKNTCPLKEVAAEDSGEF